MELAAATCPSQAVRKSTDDNTGQLGTASYSGTTTASVLTTVPTQIVHDPGQDNSSGCLAMDKNHTYSVGTWWSCVSMDEVRACGSLPLQMPIFDDQLSLYDAQLKKFNRRLRLLDKWDTTIPFLFGGGFTLGSLLARLFAARPHLMIYRKHVWKLPIPTVIHLFCCVAATVSFLGTTSILLSVAAMARSIPVALKWGPVAVHCWAATALSVVVNILNGILWEL